MSELVGRTWFRVLVLVLVPFVAVAALVWSTSGRSANIDKIPVAVVNNDKIISGPQPMAAGRALAASLTEPKKPDQNLLWTLTDSADANSGLEDGTYYAVLTIPPDFSKNILSTGTDKPVQGSLTLVSNAAASVTVPYISQQVTATAADDLGVQSTQGYLKNVYSGFNQMASSNQKAATNADSLANGTSQMSKGARQLDSGTSSLAGSLGPLSSGAASLHAGAGSLASGADGVRDGATGVSSGAHSLNAGAGRLASSSQQLARSSGELASASRKVSHGAGSLAGGSRRLSRLNRLMAAELGGLARVCERVGRMGRPCTAVNRLYGQARTAADGAVALSGGAASLARSTSRLASGATALAHGNAQLSSGARGLDSASANLSRGADQLSNGATSVASGAGTLDQSAGSLESGTQQAAAAGTSVAGGASSLNSSAGQVDSGAQQLSSGLDKGAKQSPTYSSSQQKALSTVVSQPVVLSHSLHNDKNGNGWLLALVIGLVLWLTAMLGGLRRDATSSRRQGGLPISSRRLVLAQLWPGLGLALVEAVAAFAAMLAMGVTPASVVPLALLTVLAGLVFTVMAFAARVVFGRVGVPVLVLLLVLQIAALGNVIPLQTAPTLMRTLNHILPLTGFVDGASQLVSGGHTGPVVSVFLLLLVWGVVAVLAAILAVGRRRVARAGPQRALSAGGIPA